MEPRLPAAPRLPTAARSAGMEGGLTTLIALLEFSTPPQVVFGILVGERLGIGAGTVRLHLGAIFQKLEVSNRTPAVLRFLGRR